MEDLEHIGMRADRADPNMNLPGRGQQRTTPSAYHIELLDVQFAAPRSRPPRRAARASRERIWQNFPSLVSLAD